jgi:pyruvate dehydrogenase E2 component (dihydrolipoamide acetyltransferase)
MPRLSDSMEEGTILKWLKAAGEEVGRGEALVEIETDKATMTYESAASGRLEIVAAEGDTLPIGAVIARIGAAADSSDRLGGSAGAEAAVVDVGSAGGAGSVAGAASPNAAAGVQGAPPPVAAPAPLAAEVIGPPVEHSPASAADDRSPAPTGAGERVRASPIARRIARERGVDLGSVTGSGPGGRVVRVDVEQAAAGQPALRSAAEREAARFAPVAPSTPAPAAPSTPAPAAPSTPAPAAPSTPAPAAPPSSAQESAPTRTPAPTAAAAPAGQATSTPAAGGRQTGEPESGKGIVTTQEPTRAQQVVARRMASSKATVPEFTLTAEIDMERCAELRERLRALGGERVIPSYNDIVVKACGLALREHPRANAAYRDGRFELFSRVNVGVAVAGEGVLVVPTVFDADLKPLEEIATETRRLAGRVRDGQVTPPELSGATFTVSNLGMFGVKSFTAVINPPQAAILAVGAVTRRPVVRGGELAVGHAMDVTLACDHRILYGADAARFLARLRELIEEPLALLR